MAFARVGGEGADVPEIDRLSTRATPSRRASFVAGRRAARSALRALLGVEPPRVEADARGKPTVDAPAVEVSITHAAGWALAVAARAPVGIDLVEHEALPESFIADAFAAGELDAWRRALSVQEDLTRCLAFAGKEAALKWLGVGMGVPLPSVRLAPAQMTREGSARVGRATLTHAAGRAELSLRVWPFSGALWAVMLGG